jgi:hypothetical protein
MVWSLGGFEAWRSGGLGFRAQAVWRGGGKQAGVGWRKAGGGSTRKPSWVGA